MTWLEVVLCASRSSKVSASSVPRRAARPIQIADAALTKPESAQYAHTSHGELLPEYCIRAVAMIGVKPLAKIPEN